jgi:hypothetical protein
MVALMWGLLAALVVTGAILYWVFWGEDEL